MPRIPELPPIETGDLRQDLHRMREYMIRFVQNFATEEAGYASSNDSQGNSSSDNVNPLGITVDSELSEESINPVENRVIAEAIRNIPVTELMVDATVINFYAPASDYNAPYGSIARDGYTPLGIVGVLPFDSSIDVTYAYIMPPATARFKVKNTSTSATQTSLAAYVLYRKNEDSS